MTDKKRPEDGGFAADVFDIPGTDPELLKSGRIPDPQPEHTALFAWLAEVLTTVEAFLRARGGLPLRTVIRVFWGFLAAIGLFLLVGPIINKPMDFDEVIASAKIREVDWIAQNASFDYNVTREDDGTFKTVVTEKFRANFLNGPESSILRTIITERDGQNLEFELHDATIDGQPADVFERHKATSSEVSLMLESREKFEGTHDFELTYELHNLVVSDVDANSGNDIDNWTWPIFAPSWTQATSGLEVSVTLPRDVNDELVREPYATVGWLLVSGNVWLTPDEETDEWVRYSVTNDQNLPPNSDVWIKLSFAPGTFELPEKTTLFWVQTWGPLLPLALLAVVMLFALAARRVVWADSAGEPWFLARSDPPEDLTPDEAANLLGKPRHAELVGALASGGATASRLAAAEAKRAAKGRAPKHRKLRGNTAKNRERQRDIWLQQIGQAGRRAGRWGNIVTTLQARWRWKREGDRLASDELTGEKLRWKPDSYIRDTFVLAPIALTLVQVGILRQLAEQYILLIVWWPFAFVAASTIIAGIAIWAVDRPRPLTPAGARMVQQLKGIDVWARGTRLLERGPIEDELLPYAVLFESPRRAGNAVIEHARRETGSDRFEATRGWRHSRFLSGPSIVGFLVSIALFAGSIVLAATQEPRYGGFDFLTRSEDAKVPGALYSELEGFEIEGELTRDAEGRARLDVVERLTVAFAPRSSWVPQLEREWISTRFGQSLDLEVESVRIDGSDVPFEVVVGPYTSKMHTLLADVIDGDRDVEVRYSLGAPAVDAMSVNGTVQQVRWAAMPWGWDDTFYVVPGDFFGDKQLVRPVRVQLTVAGDLSDEMQSGGWIGRGDAESEPLESGSGFDQWVSTHKAYVEYDRDAEERNASGDPDEDFMRDTVGYDIRVGNMERRADNALVVTFDADQIESRTAKRYVDGADVPPGEWDVRPEVNAELDKYDLGLQHDFGPVLNFKDGTFTNVDSEGFKAHQIWYQGPLAALIVFTLLILFAAIGIMAFVLRSGWRASGSLVLTSAGTMTLAAVAQTVFFWWIIGSMPGSEAYGGWNIALGLAMWAAVIAQWFVVGSRALNPPVDAEELKL